MTPKISSLLEGDVQKIIRECFGLVKGKKYGLDKCAIHYKLQVWTKLQSYKFTV